MTITLSSISQHSNMILMLSDRAITNTYFDDFGNQKSVEYTQHIKYLSFPGVGCVTMWGRLSGNRLHSHLMTKNITAPNYSVEDLARTVYHYLKNDFRPHEYDDPEDVGYHVGGYDRSARPRLYHFFWGCNRPPALNEKPDYHDPDHSFPGFLYNGRNDLADNLVLTYIDQIQQGQPTRYSIDRLKGLIQFCDFVGRFAAEMTPQVGPPLDINLIFPRNEIHVIQNASFCPIKINDNTAKILERFDP